MARSKKKKLYLTDIRYKEFFYATSRAAAQKLAHADCLGYLNNKSFNKVNAIEVPERED